MNYVRSTAETAKERVKAYTTFRGMDAANAAEEIEDYRSPDMHDMYIRDGVAVKRHGYEKVRDIPDGVLGLHRMPGALLIHTGKKLIALPFDGSAVTVPAWAAGGPYNVGDCVTNGGGVFICRTKNTDVNWIVSHWERDDTEGLVYGGMSTQNRSGSFYMKNALYLLDGKRYSAVRRNGTTFTAEAVSENAHIPITGIGGYYNYDAGEPVWIDCRENEERNLLTPYQQNTMCGDGSNNAFWLTANGCTVTLVEIMNSSTRDWEVTTDYTASEDSIAHKTKILFGTAPDMHPDGAGLDNIRVTFYRSDDSDSAEQINACTIAAAYGYFNDNRVFLSGNPQFPNRDWASGIDDPTYMEENGWANIGSDAAAIIGYLHYGDVLAIMKEDNNTDAEIYIRSGTVKEDGNILFPVQQGVKGVGAVSKTAFANLRDDALFLAKEGVYAVAGTDASQQKTVQNRSKLIDPLITAEADKDKAAAVVWDDRLLVSFPGGDCFVADARMKTGASDSESYGYEWVKWTNIPAAFFVNEDGTLYFASEDALYVFNDGYTDDGAPVTCAWSTKSEHFDAPGYYKSMLKRGSHAILKTGGAVKVTAVTEDGSTDVLDTVTEDRGVRAISLRKNVKKFRTVRMKAENAKAEPFELHGFTVCYVTRHVIK